MTNSRQVDRAATRLALKMERTDKRGRKTYPHHAQIDRTVSPELAAVMVAYIRKRRKGKR